MTLIQYFQQAWSNLFSAKLRSLLAVLGILVGVASVVAMVTSGQMATEKALSQFKDLGTDLLAVNLFAEHPANGKASTNTFGLQESLALAKTIPGIKAIAPYATIFAPLTLEGYEIKGNLIGATHTLQPIIKIELAAGRFISFLDFYSYYCVIGDDIYQQLLKHGIWSPLGKQLQLGDNFFTIIGIAKKWPRNGFFNEDINSSVLIPIRTASVISKYATINNITLQLRQNTDINRIQRQITQAIETTSPGMRLFFRSAEQLIQQMQQQHQTLTLLLGLIGSISLFVGGIGVMNIMLVSVVERRREIGIRRAIGARRRDIQRLFLIESIALAFVGGLLGILIGILASWIIASVANWKFQLFFLPPLIGFLVSVATGVFFGFYPAYKAAQLDPIVALRSD